MGPRWSEFYTFQRCQMVAEKQAKDQMGLKTLATAQKKKFSYTGTDDVLTRNETV